ncbi:alpha-galactosidase [Chitinophaga nivalis]|uniref:Alpha-galactosidase n=1 Tax=Chitinophaga nivalis TaxID=2991709 RepID=A0ABT3IVA4_9BACT|nr:alpha-galactosidase [Chitinophaga nivalis]MCW3462401.1 alpha-galactosidase [Chitinophaga nivalis]MCW3487908.1 alpha-galactosidase [Chitinophaga nivalis]
MKRLMLFCLFLLPCLAFAQNQLIQIATQHTKLVYGISREGKLIQRFLGDRQQPVLPDSLVRLVQEAYVPAGMESLLDPAIRMIHPDGNPSLDLQYVTHATTRKNNLVTLTTITLKDPVYPVNVTLYFEAYEQEDVIKAWSAISHTESQPVRLTAYASSMLHFNPGKYWLTQFHGNWAKEANMTTQYLTPGMKVLDSKLGVRANMFQSPMFLLGVDKPAEENTGDVLAGTLAWTGNFRFGFEIDENQSLHISSGINPYASEYTLPPNEVFTTPALIFTWSSKGTGLASRNLHHWALNYGVLDGHGPRFTLLNNWEATGMDFNEQKLTHLFGDAARLGVDLFLLDDGWFGNKFPRNNDHAGLGDWDPDTTKLPHGLGYLVKEADKQGVKFGIWLEPEMVNPKSELYSQHPDWILRLPNRAEHYFRNQLVLDLTNPAVQDFVVGVVDKTLSQAPGIAYIKWDCNRMLTNTYAPFLQDKQSHLFIAYTRSLYQVLERVRAKYPHLPIMLCSGGGGRTDYGALKYFTEFWPSDNTDGLERIYIQYGYSHFFPAKTMAAHVTNWGRQSLKFRTDVAMMGKLGYDIKVSDFTPQELQFSQHAVKTYSRISDIVWSGNIYRLVSPYEQHRAVFLYSSENRQRAIIFNYMMQVQKQDIFPLVKLQGLDPHRHYRIKEINLFPGTVSSFNFQRVYRGDFLMNVGINLSGVRPQALTSNIFELTAE